MAKAQGKGDNPGTAGAAGEEVEGIPGVNLGNCGDCEKPVDVMVRRDQHVGTNRFICPECKAARMISNAEGEAAKVIADAQKAREDLRQMKLPGME